MMTAGLRLRAAMFHREPQSLLENEWIWWLIISSSTKMKLTPVTCCDLFYKSLQETQRNIISFKKVCFIPVSFGFNSKWKFVALTSIKARIFRVCVLNLNIQVSIYNPIYLSIIIIIVWTGLYCRCSEVRLFYWFRGFNDHRLLSQPVLMYNKWFISFKSSFSSKICQKYIYRPPLQMSDQKL